LAGVDQAAHRLLGGRFADRTRPRHRTSLGCRPDICRLAVRKDRRRNDHPTKERTMSTSTDYTKLAASLDYAALEKKLTQLAERQPPKKRKNAADVLEPLRERLLDLQSKGWSSGQLAAELKAAGIPVSPARLRDCLNRWTSGDGKTVRRPARQRQAVAPTAATSPTSTPTPATAKKPVIGTPPGGFTLR
jgi:hypothetical protein